MLHPQFKQQYFAAAKWEPAWIKTAEEIVRTVWKDKYATREVAQETVAETAPSSDDEVRT